jgi:small multidrug resistance pump
MSPWILLALTVVLEVAATLSLRAAGNGDWRAIVVVIVGYGLSYACLALVMRKLDVSIVYAIWASAGTALVAVIAIVFMGEAVNTLKVVGLLLIIAGVVSLNLSGAH